MIIDKVFLKAFLEKSSTVYNLHTTVWFKHRRNIDIGNKY